MYLTVQNKDKDGNRIDIGDRIVTNQDGYLKFSEEMVRELGLSNKDSNLELKVDREIIPMISKQFYSPIGAIEGDVKEHYKIDDDWLAKEGNLQKLLNCLINK